MRPIVVVSTLAVLIPTSASAQVWRMFQFTGTEYFEYAISRAGPNGTEKGSFSLRMGNSDGQATASIAASLGEASCAATIPIANQQAALPQLMMQCMVIAPVAMTMFAPSWAIVLRQPWVEGTTMNMDTGANPFTFEITEACRHAGQRGLVGLLRMSGLEINACVNPALPLPLSVRMNNTMDGEVVEAVLTSYEP